MAVQCTLHEPLERLARMLLSRLWLENRASGGSNNWFDLDNMRKYMPGLQEYARADWVDVINHSTNRRDHRDVWRFQVWWDADITAEDGYRYQFRLEP